MDLAKLKPTSSFNLSRLDFPHCGDLTKPFFVTVGCSFTAGESLDYMDTWPFKLGKLLGMEHLNIGYNGTSIEYQSDKITLVKQLLPQAKFIIWMQSYPTRSHSKLKILGDNQRRIRVHKPYEDPQTWKKLVHHTDMHIKDCVITNAWGYDHKFVKLLQGRYRKTLNYYVNSLPIIDYGSDHIHPGPNSHSSFVNQIFKRLNEINPKER